jgi:hypothetical protein
VRSLKDPENGNRVEYEIKEKDIIKLGRVKYSVKEIGRSEEAKAPPTVLDLANAANSINHNVPAENQDKFEEFENVGALVN